MGDSKYGIVPMTRKVNLLGMLTHFYDFLIAGLK